ncbi:MAG: two-component sensor histidine kinase [Tetrasphaera sp.]|nr:two-component sensor histidine kinase [Tetrasphaera sp.]
MDVTTAAILGGCVGIVLGSVSVVSLRLSEREQRGLHGMPPPPDIPDGASTILAVLSSSALVLDAAERVVNNSPTAVADGFVVDGRLVVPELVELSRAVRRDGVIRERELELPRGRGGPPIYVHVRAAPILDAHVLLLIDDHTQVRRVEEVRRDFVVNVSHELKTPVGGLSLLAEAIMDAKGDPEATDHFAHRMQLESARLGKLIKEIVDLSQLQSQDVLAGAEPVRIADVVAEAIEVSLIEARAKDIALTARCAPDMWVRGDFGLLVTAVRNLVGNAIAYSPNATEVAVGAEVTDDEASITVTDRGRGIPAAEQERIFERFYRGDAARSRSTGGTGLGLAIVKHICTNHGGQVSVWSQEGHGSTFTITLPLLAHPQHAAAESSRVPRPEGSAA